MHEILSKLEAIMRENSTNKIELFTDGACSGNPGPGGWGAILRWRGIDKELYGGEENTTNNRMEALAVIFVTKTLQQS